MTICVIPARGGSKRVPRKNIKNFFGKPMIQWSIEAAKKSNIFNKIIVSTDDNEIAKVSKDLGATVPFMRPKELSDDYTSTIDVIAHACDWVKKNDLDTGTVCCLYATSPFILPSDLIEANKIMNEKELQYIFSVSEYPSSIFRSFKLTNKSRVDMLFPNHFFTRSQDLPDTFHDAGMFYMGKTDAWLQGLKMFDKHSYGYKIPRWRVQDIDTIDDWLHAEKMAKFILKS